MKSVEQIRMYRPKDFPNLEIWDIKNSVQCPRIYHETYSICTVNKNTKGRSEWRYRNKDYHSKSGSIIVVEPGYSHATQRVFGVGDYHVAYFPPELVMAAGVELGLKRSPHLKNPDPKLPFLFSALERFHASLYTETTTLERSSRLTQCVHLFLEQCLEDRLSPISKPAQSGLMRSREYILAHFDKRISLVELAQIAGLSRYHFLRAFHQVFGEPPHTFQNRLRLTRARDLLGRGVPLEGIDVGFSDQSHFIRHFKNVLGVTPGQYARMCQKNLNFSVGSFK